MIIVSKSKAEAVSNGIFLISIAILYYLNAWWPGIILSIWATLATRQYLTARQIDLAVTSTLLIGLFVVTYFRIDIYAILPAAFILVGIYLVLREYFYRDTYYDRDRGS